ncbi:MAG: hypothetical protein ACM3X7_14045 [Solirubrobacterales bacterium]
MIGEFKAAFISQRSVESTKVPGKFYHYLKLNDGTSDMEIEMEKPVQLERFQECVVHVDITQGKYPKYKCVLIKPYVASKTA